jgi:ribosomal protein S16
MPPNFTAPLSILQPAAWFRIKRKWVTEQRTEADEKTGTYDPIPKAPTDGEGKRWKDIKLDFARAKYWLGVGAQPSDPAWRLLSMVCLILNSSWGEVLDWELGWS